MPELPTGTVTFLFTDIEGSTVRWEHHPEAMRVALARHDALLRRCMQNHAGTIFKTAGDAFYVAFAAPIDALIAAISTQRALAAETWPEEIESLRVRMAIHTGTAEQRCNDYFGQPLNRVARLLSAGHGCQILLSSITRTLLSNTLPQEIALLDLGEHYLKDLENPERIFQVIVADLPSAFPPLKTQDRFPNNLPLQLTPFIGRTHDQKTVADLLLREDVRLITLIGPGGIGKTRLALQVASTVAATFPQGLFFVDLSTTHDPDTVLPVIGQALSIREADGKPLLERLKELLKGRVLLILDNFEQVTDAAPLVMDVLVGCPHLKVIVTSRAALSLTGEHEYHVEPLSLPDFKPHIDVAELLQYEAIALFIQQARNVKLDFQLTQANATAVVEICRRLDGLPLAIELAAARIKMFSPQAMLKLLKRRLQVLKDEKRDRTQRQQTLRGAIAWSYDLLHEEEKQLFTQLAVFSGGCTLDAIITVCPVVEDLTSDVLDALKSLIDKSLLRLQDQDSEEPRFVMLHTIRDFALEQLTTYNSEKSLRRRHFDYYLSIAEEAAPALVGTEQRHWLELLEYEHDNLITALWWCSEQGAIESGASLAGTLWRFWLMRGYLHEGRHWLDTFLIAKKGQSVVSVARVKVLEGASILAMRQKDYERATVLAQEMLALSQSIDKQDTMANAYTLLAEMAYMRGESERAVALFEESLTIRRAIGDQRGTASLLNNLGNVALQQGALERATDLFEKSQNLFRVVGDELALASVLNNLGEVERRRGNYERSRLLYEESLKVSRTLKYTWGIAASLANLGGITCNQADYAYSLACYRESLELFHQMGEKFGIALCLGGLAEIAYTQGQLELATRLLALSASLRQSIGVTTLQLAPATSENMSATLRSALGGNAFESLWRSGQTSSLEQITADAMAVEIIAH